MSLWLWQVFAVVLGCMCEGPHDGDIQQPTRVILYAIKMAAY